MAEWRWAHLQFRLPVRPQIPNETWARMALGLSVPVRKPSAAFGGRSALDIMLRGEITDLIDLRAFLDAERGAW